MRVPVTGQLKDRRENGDNLIQSKAYDIASPRTDNDYSLKPTYPNSAVMSNAETSRNIMP